MHSRLGIVCRSVASVAILAGLAASARGGNYSWTTAGPQTGYVFQILVNSQDSERLDAAVGFYGPISSESSDRGQAWHEQGTILFNGRLIPHPTDGNVLYTIGLFGDTSGVLKSLDGGASWAAAGAGLPTSPTISSIAISPSDPLTLYAIFGEHRARYTAAETGRRAGPSSQTPTLPTTSATSR